jgi:hypothetical protein
MIDNGIIYETSINLDMDYLKNMIAEHQYARKQGLAGHQRLVDDDPYLRSIKKDVPFLSTVFNIYTTRPNSGIQIHTDAKRQCALNIPIANTVHSKTSFYEFAEEPNLVYNERFVFHEIRSKVNEIFSFSLTRPVLINNSIPHGVRHYGAGDRVIISWSIDDNTSFSEAREFFKQVGY